ncbi:unnamed protein product [Cylindrotheca closterium]|uniref:DUF6824 domain-containing protein n=1 Tax=Cylindrotheca closterium TaxID=2856 RepID=A0AAD2CL48_9STRA|nr:unnamed protein product [Cylindrotheca closterium]
MSGLDSIALAVAHLEERQKESNPAILGRNPSDASAASSVIPVNAASASASAANSASQTMAPAASSLSHNRRSLPSNHIPSPPPRAIHVSPAARVVSVDEPSFNAAHAMAKSHPPSRNNNSTVDCNTNNNGNSTFGCILADPIKWLQKTQDRPPLLPPSDLVQKVEPADVLCGRGGETNHHPGNVQYRLLVKAFQPLYVSAKRRDKPLIAQCIVYSVRQAGGRFLKRANDKEWKDVGNTKAREKTSQALREGAPELRGDAVPKMMPKQQMLMPTAPPQMPPSPAPGQPMSFVEARFLSALLAQQAALTRSVVVNQHPQHQHQHQQPPSGQNVNVSHPPSHPPMAPASAANVILPQPEYLQQQQQPQKQSLPPLQPPTAAVPQAPSTTPAASENTTTRKRPAVVSDGHSDSDSIGSNSSSSAKGIPLKKRFKMRFQQESSSSSA